MFRKKTIVLTGANGGIGSEIAKALSEENATLVLVGRDKTALYDLVQKMSGQHHVVQADISTTAGRQSIVDYCQSLEKGVDTLVNNAGLGQFSLLHDLSEQRIIDIVNTNLSSTIILSQMFLPLLLTRPQAQIINIGSILGSIGFPGSTVYCASKFGIKGFSEALGRELADTSVVVSYFAPRATKTIINSDSVVAMNDELGTKMDTPQQVADAFVNFLKSQKSRFYMGWPEKAFVRINSVLPSIVDKSIIKQLPIIKRYLKGE